MFSSWSSSLLPGSKFLYHLLLCNIHPKAYWSSCFIDLKQLLYYNHVSYGKGIQTGHNRNRNLSLLCSVMSQSGRLKNWSLRLGTRIIWRHSHSLSMVVADYWLSPQLEINEGKEQLSLKYTRTAHDSLMVQ